MYNIRKVSKLTEKLNMENNTGIGILVALTFTSTVFVINTEYYTKNQKVILYLLFLFPPAQWILGTILLLWNKQNTNTIGFSVDKSNKQIDELKKLRTKGVLTEDEYESKVKIIIEKQELDNFTKSAEYKSLEKLKDSGILTKNEFKEKSELLKNSFLKGGEKSEETRKNNFNPFTTNYEKGEDFFSDLLNWISIIVVVVISVLEIFSIL